MSPAHRRLPAPGRGRGEHERLTGPMGLAAEPHHGGPFGVDDGRASEAESL